MKSGKAIKAQLRKIKTGLFDKNESKGTSANEYRKTVHDDIEKNSDDYGDALTQLIDAAITSVWEESAGPRSDSQYALFTVDGIALDAEFTFHASAEDGGYKKVAGQYALVRHAEDHAGIALEKAGQASEKAGAKTRAARELLRRADFNRDARIADLVDTQYEVAAA